MKALLALGVVAALAAAPFLSAARARAATPQDRFVEVYSGSFEQDRHPRGVHVGRERVHVFTAEGAVRAWDIPGRALVEPSPRFQLGGLGRGERFAFAEDAFGPPDGTDRLERPLKLKVGIDLRRKVEELGLEVGEVQDDTKELRVQGLRGRLGPRLYLSPDRSTLALVDGDPHFSGREELLLFREEDLQAGTVTASKVRRALPGLHAVRISRDGGRVFALHGSGTLLVDPRGNAPDQELPRASDVHVAPDGAGAVLFTGDAVQFWRAEGPARAPLPLGAPPLDACWSRDSETLAIVTASKLVLVEPRSGSEPRELDVGGRARGRIRSVWLVDDAGPPGPPRRGRQEVVLGRLQVLRPPRGDREGRARAAVERLDLQGGLRSRSEFETAEWNASTPDVRVLPGGDVLVRTRDSVRVLVEGGR